MAKTRKPASRVATLNTLTRVAGKRYREVPVTSGDDDVIFIIASLTERERKTYIEDWIRDADGNVNVERQRLYPLRLLQLCLVDENHVPLFDVVDVPSGTIDEAEKETFATLQQVDSGIVKLLVDEIIDHTRIRKASVEDAVKNSD